MGKEVDGVFLSGCSAVAVTAEGTVFLSRFGRHSVWRVARDGSLTKILDASGAGDGKIVKAARGVAVDAKGRVYVTGLGSHNVFRIVPPPAGAARWGEKTPAGAKTPEDAPAPEAEKKPEDAPGPAEAPAGG